MPWQSEFRLPRHSKGCHLITQDILDHINPGLKDVKIGILHLFVKHTSCAITVNENYDPDVRTDMDMALDKIVPEELKWLHTDEGADDSVSHTKAALVGPAVQIPITDGCLNLGTWQGIYLAEFRHMSHERRVVATILLRTWHSQMPRAQSSPSAPTLRRNQACKTCRKKKLKCDAKRPHCSQCEKHWRGMIAVPPPDGYFHPTSPQCSYDPVEGLTFADSSNPAEKIRELQEKIEELKLRLQEVGATGSPAASDSSMNGIRITPMERLDSLAPPRYSLTAPKESPEIVLPQGGLSDFARGIRPRSATRSATSSPETPSGKGVENILQLFALGWNPDLPDPREMDHLIQLFFAYDPCGSRILHEQTFRDSMLFGAKDPRFPHSAILHAICASASRWADIARSETIDGVRRDRFAEYHAGKTRQYIDRTMASGADIFQVLQACIILSWYFYSEGRWVEVWIFAGFQTRVSVPLRLNYRGTYSTHGPNSPGAYLGAPKDPRDLEMRRRTWWMSIILDRIVSVGGWLHGIEYQHIATELPMRMDNFRHENYIDNPQALTTPYLYVTHPVEHTDGFLLFLKSVMLFGQVTDFNTEFQLKNQGLLTTPYREPKFGALDKLLAEDFLASLPAEEKNYLTDIAQGSRPVNSDSYMVHLIPHAALITLHNPYMDFNEPNSWSTNRCLAAANAILEAYYDLTKALTFVHLANAPMTHLHPFVTNSWYLAAVVKIQVCKHMIDNNNSDQEIVVWGEINAMRNAMLEFGSKSPVGTRQEKLLGNLMSEIVRSTSQDKPLEICGLPISRTNIRLYPHSQKTVFDGSNNVGAPLPTSPSVGADFETQMGNMSSVNASLQGSPSLHGSQNMWFSQHSAQSRSPQAHISPNDYMM